MSRLKQATIAAALCLSGSLAGCQTYVDAAGRTHLTAGDIAAPRPAISPGPGEAYVPDEAIASGVGTFNELYFKDAFTTV